MSETKHSPEEVVAMEEAAQKQMSGVDKEFSRLRSGESVNCKSVEQFEQWLESLNQAESHFHVSLNGDSGASSMNFKELEAAVTSSISMSESQCRREFGKDWIQKVKAAKILFTWTHSGVGTPSLRRQLIVTKHDGQEIDLTHSKLEKSW